MSTTRLPLGHLSPADLRLCGIVEKKKTGLDESESLPVTTQSLKVSVEAQKRQISPQV